MPNLDGGHYFFTAVVPVCNEGIVEHRGMKSSPIHMVREALETLPTALHSEAAEEVGIQSPFARSDRTHFARLVVLDQPFYNGRDPSDAIVNAVRKPDLLAAQACDALSCPYLLVMFDFDPVAEDGDGEPRAYLEHLWEAMPAELTEVFRYCYTFSQVRDARSFADFLLACQVETTMPFNDYWIEPPKLPSLPLLAVGAVPALAALGTIGGALAALVLTFLHSPRAGTWWTVALDAFVILALSLLTVYAIVMRRGAKPFPTSDASLRQVLKALYVQQAFARFAIDQQGAEPAAAGAAFRAFLAEHRPRDLSGPTQEPGVIRTRFEGAAP
ncbi:MAG TPA: hypothetical protein VF727_15395 [Allosphingosinicella sp.]|jgi:hypothetical protein